MVSLLGLQPQTLLQSVLDNVGVALAVVGLDRRFVFANRAALDMFGATADLSLAEWRRDYKFHDSQGAEISAGEAPIMRAFAGEEVEPHEVRVTFPNGGMKWLHVAGHGFSVLGLTGVLIIVTDETEQIELRKRMERVQQMEALGVLAGGLAHDFNNILSILLDNIALALRDEGVQDVTAVRLQQMAGAVKTATALVKRLMQSSRPNDVQAAPLVQINEAVNAALELTHPLFKGRVRVHTQMSDSLPAVQANLTSIQQVIVNLIVNALDAMPQGGDLTISTKLVSETPEGRTEENKKQFVVITVADTGIGIPEKIRPSIFEPFFTTKGSRGVGLGLSSAKEIVRRHKGHIKVESTPGAGTKFRIHLPVEENCSER